MHSHTYTFTLSFSPSTHTYRYTYALTWALILKHVDKLKQKRMLRFYNEMFHKQVKKTITVLPKL